MAQPILQIIITGAGGAAFAHPIVGDAQYSSVNVEVPIAAAGVFEHWRAIGRSFLTGGKTRQLHLQKNGATAMSTAVFSGGNTIGSNLVDTVTVAAGDRVRYSRTDTGGSTEELDIDCSWDWVPDDGVTQLYGWMSTSLTQTSGTTHYVGLLGDSFRGTTEATESNVCGVAGTITAHYVRCNTPPGSGKDKSYTIIKNGVAQDGTGGTPNTTVTIADLNQQASATFSLSISQFDTLSVRVTVGTGTTADVASAGTIAFTPTTANEKHYGGASDTLPGGAYAARHFWPQTSGIAPGSDRTIDGPYTAITIDEFYVELTQAPGGVTSRTFALELNGVEQSGWTITISGTDTFGSVSPGLLEITSGDEWSITELATGLAVGCVAKWTFIAVEPPPVSESNLLTGDSHTVEGSNNLIAGTDGTVTGDRNALFALCDGSPPPSITGNNTFKVCADTIELEALVGGSISGISISGTALADLEDVALGSPIADADVLTYDTGTGKWTNEPSAGGGALTDLTDVALTSPLSDGDVLTYDSGTGQWTNEAPPGAGSGDSTHTAAYGSRPAASNDGDLFFPSNGFYVERDTGAAWVPWGPLFPMTAPVDSGYSWVNQGSGAIDTTNGGIYLSIPAEAGATTNWRGRVKTAPSAPYVITAFILPHALNVNFHSVALWFRESGTGEIVTFSIEFNTSARLAVHKYNSPTSFNSTYVTAGLNIQPIWLRIADDNTNRICSWSHDGQHWFQFHSIGRTDFLTADQVGFGVQSANTTWGVGMTLLSWLES